ncbi:MAG: mechanosensitive ion channel family protein [Porticoccaceae bacterium]|nr:mechanosensitive ion channel family protein [Porticoccaceae bacterium]
MLQSFENWLINLTQLESVWWIEVFIIVFAVLLLGFAANKIISMLERRANKTKNIWDDALVEAMRKPVVWLIWVVGINFAAGIAAGMFDSSWGDLLGPLNRVAVLFLGALFLVNFIKRGEQNLVNPEYLDQPMDETTVRAVGKLLRAAVIITVTLIAMQVFGYSVSGLLAFGGIGGLAIGFAAKDLLANFFGGLMIYLDRPFAVGDWIRSPDRNIEGTVEDIGWRLTRIRTFDKRPLYIPNSLFNNMSVENPSRMTSRRIYETLGIRYDDIAVMQDIVAEVKSMLKAHPDIDVNQTMIVNFNSFSSSSLDFFIYTFTKTTDWIRFHEIKQEILLMIAGIIAKHNAEIAFPTSTVHLLDDTDEGDLVLEEQGI